MDTYEKKYKNALEKAKSMIDDLRKGEDILAVSNLESMFPELTESEDERLRNVQLDYWRSVGGKEWHGVPVQETIAWLEKQCDTKEAINKDEFAEGVLRGAAINLITWIDYNAAEGNMCLSNTECKDIEDALVRGDWNKIYAYMKKKLEKQDEKKHIFDFNANNWYVSKVDGKIHNIYNSGVEPKFHKDEWVVNNATLNLCHILRVEHGQYICDDCSFPITKENEYHLWTIQDAKDGDVLAYVTDEEDLWIMIYWSLYEPYEGHVHYHALLVNDNFSDKGTCCICINDLKPATKEQRELLFSKMKEAGYEWDAEKKELRKIEEEYDGEDYGIDSLFHAQRILEKTLGKVEGYQSDDGILSHKCAITAVKKLYGQKPTWSEEDEHRAKDTIYFLDTAKKHYASTVELDACIDWLKSIKQKLL